MARHVWFFNVVLAYGKKLLGTQSYKSLSVFLYSRQEGKGRKHHLEQNDPVACRCPAFRAWRAGSTVYSVSNETVRSGDSQRNRMQLTFKENDYELLPQAGLEPTTFCILGRCSMN